MIEKFRMAGAKSRKVRRALVPAIVLAVSAFPAFAQTPLQTGDFSFTVTSSDPNPGDGLCETPAANNDNCAHTLVDVTVGGTTFTTLTTPSSFSAAGFPVGSNVQSRIYDVPGDFVFGDANYNANMLANVFSDNDLNRYQQVGSSANLGSFTLGYATPVPADANNFFLITERNGNNTQFVEAFDTNGVSMGTVEVTGRSADYTNTGRDVGFNQPVNIALIPLDRFADTADPSRQIQSFGITNTAGDGGDFKAFIIGVGTVATPVANDDVEAATPGAPIVFDADANDTGGVDPGSVLFTTTTSPAGASLTNGGLTLTVPGEGVWTANDPVDGSVTFTPEAGFTGVPTPASYTVANGAGTRSNEATLSATFATPVANDDVEAATPGAPIVFDADANDTGGVDPGSVLFTTTTSPAGASLTNGGLTLTVPGEGVWTANDPVDGSVTFTPEAGFTGVPTPASYTVANGAGTRSNEATLSATFATPVANDDVEAATPGAPIVFDADANDTGGVDPGSVLFTTTTSPAGASLTNGGLTLTVPGEGVWTANDPVDGSVTFTPEAGFTGVPTPASYTVANGAGTRSNEATLSATFATPVANDDVEAATPGAPIVFDADANDTGGVDPGSVLFTTTTSPAGVEPDEWRADADGPGRGRLDGERPGRWQRDLHAGGGLHRRADPGELHGGQRRGHALERGDPVGDLGLRHDYGHQRRIHRERDHGRNDRDGPGQ